MRWLAIPLVGLVALTSPAMAADGLSLYAAGSLKAALTDVAKAYEEVYGAPIEMEFAASGLLPERIEGGEHADVFASANKAHPQALMAKGLGGPVALFARNRLCALAQPDVVVDSANLLEVMLRPDVKLGTSTPKADPSGDCAWQVFEKADALRPGSFAQLDAKALKLTGGPDSVMIEVITLPPRRRPAPGRRRPLLDLDHLAAKDVSCTELHGVLSLAITCRALGCIGAGGQGPSRRAWRCRETS